MPERHTLLTVIAGTRHRDAGLRRGLAGGDLALAGLEHLAHQHVVDLLGSDAGALERGLDRDAAEVHRGEVGERARQLPDRRTCRSDDHRAGHGASSRRRRAASLRRSDSVGTGGSRPLLAGSFDAHELARSTPSAPRSSSGALRPTRSPALPLPDDGARRAGEGRRAGDVRRASTSDDKDPRKSTHVEDFPLPELAPDEAYVAVMASAINFNTVWTSIFEPLPTFGFLKRLGREIGVGRAPRPAVPRDGLRRVGCRAAGRLGGAQLEAGRRGHGALPARRRPGPDARTTTR